MATLAIPDSWANMRHSVESDASWQIHTFTRQLPKYRHVWIWDAYNGALTFTQIRRYTNAVRVRHWHSPAMCVDIKQGISLLRPTRMDPQWIGRDALYQMQQALIRES